MADQLNSSRVQVNLIGLKKADYRGNTAGYDREHAFDLLDRGALALVVHEGAGIDDDCLRCHMAERPGQYALSMPLAILEVALVE